MTISEKVAYLKGLAEGLGLDTEKSKEGKLISVMVGILEEIGLSIEDLEENALALGEEIDALSDDLADVEEIFLEDAPHAHSHADAGCGCGCGCEDDAELPCPNCGEDIPLTDESFEAGSVTCENCDSSFSIYTSDCCGEEDEDLED